VKSVLSNVRIHVLTFYFHPVYWSPNKVL